MARGAIVWEGKSLIECPAGAYLYFSASGEAGFSDAPELLLKTETPGTLYVKRSGGRELALVDPLPSQTRELCQALFMDDGEQIVISVDAEMTRYWLRLRF